MLIRVLVFSSLIFVCIGVPVGLGAQEKHAKSVEETRKEVFTVEQELRHAVRQDTEDTLDRLLADHMVWLAASGEILTKTQVLANIRSGDRTGLLIRADDRQLHVYGNTAVIYSTTRGGHRSTGTDEMSPRKVVTEVFVNQGGQWRLVAYGATFFAGE